MEEHFIKILNRTLLAGCFVLLASAILMAFGAGANFIEGSNPAADHSDIVVSYVPLPPIPASPATPANNATDQMSPSDLALMDLATRGCQAVGRIAKVISANKLDLQGVALTTCEKEQVDQSKEFGDKAQNYLGMFSSNFDSMANDPHLATNYQNLSDDETRTVVDNLGKAFASKFRAGVDAQNAKNTSSQVDAAAHRITSITYFGIAGSAFLAFLFVAFLIVFLRIEKHLEATSAQIGSALRARG